MTAPDLSAAEAEIVARFDAAPTLREAYRPPHVLVVIDGDDQEYPEYAIECPGLSDSCRAWRQCPDCDKRAATDEDFDDELHAEGEAHGVEHQKLMGDWMIPSNACLVATHDYLWDAASDVTREPGRYPVAHTFEDDGEYLVLEAVSSETGL